MTTSRRELVIKCDLVEIPEYTIFGVSDDSKLKHGRYHGSMFWDIPEFAVKRWVVAAKIELLEDIKGVCDQEVIERCVEFINTPPPRKKFERRKKKPKYGKLELYKAKVHRSEEGTYISALLITDKRKSKHFWGRGRAG